MDYFRKKIVIETFEDDKTLARCLSGFDLMFMGIGAVIGAGIFVLTGIVAATQAGPAIVLSYIIAGLACAFSALSYAELAASIGGCGSAYGYAYAGFGELIAWIVGWDLLLEYALTVSTVSVGWSGYFNDFLKSLSIYLPKELVSAPELGGHMNLLATGIIFFLTIVLLLGIKASARFNNLMVWVKVGVIAIFIAIASRHVNVQYWSPFMPFGWNGVVHGASIIFFAYIGFDAVSTTAEEAINPQRDVPMGIIGSLVICTLIYVVVSGLLTGIVPSATLNVSSPITHALLQIGYRAAAGLIGVGAIAGLTTVMLVLFYALSRIFFAMARDGLLPVWFSHANVRTKTPVRIILLCGFIMGLVSGLVPIHALAELVNVGTLFAFITVCLGVIVLHYTQPQLKRPFKTPLMPWIPILGVLSCSYLIYHLPGVTLARFGIWMLAGLIIYWFYSRRTSLLNDTTHNE